MFFSITTYWIQQERIADFRREAEHERLIRIAERNQEGWEKEPWYRRFLYPLVFRQHQSPKGRERVAFGKTTAELYR